MPLLRAKRQQQVWFRKTPRRPMGMRRARTHKLVGAISGSDQINKHQALKERRTSLILGLKSLSRLRSCPQVGE
jgi:hypothetical protein